MGLGNLSCARTRWPHGLNCPSTVRLKSVCVGIRFLGNRVTAVHFFVMEGMQIKGKCPGASERETKGSGYGCSCVWTLTLLFHWKDSQKKSSLSSVHCSWAHLKCIVKFSRNIEYIGFWKDQSQRGKKRCFTFNGWFKINLLKMFISQNKKLFP